MRLLKSPRRLTSPCLSPMITVSFLPAGVSIRTSANTHSSYWPVWELTIATDTSSGILRRWNPNSLFSDFPSIWHSKHVVCRGRTDLNNSMGKNRHSIDLPRQGESLKSRCPPADYLPAFRGITEKIKEPGYPGQLNSWTGIHPSIFSVFSMERLSAKGISDQFQQ